MMDGSEERLVHWIVESTRHVREIVSRKDSAPAFAKQATPAQPWTRVNNCTKPFTCPKNQYLVRAATVRLQCVNLAEDLALGNLDAHGHTNR